MNKTCVYVNSRPSITVSFLSSKSLDRCYSEGTYKIVSTNRLQSKQIDALWKGGFLGRGQEWGIRSQCDGKEEPAGYDTLEAYMIDDHGNRLDEPAVNFFGEPVKPDKSAYFEYVTFYRVDSGD
jgi:hypothetical protein